MKSRIQVFVVWLANLEDPVESLLRKRMKRLKKIGVSLILAKPEIPCGFTAIGTYHFRQSSSPAFVTYDHHLKHFCQSSSPAWSTFVSHHHQFWNKISGSSTLSSVIITTRQADFSHNRDIKTSVWFLSSVTITIILTFVSHHHHL